MFSKKGAVCAAYKLGLRHRWHWSQGEEKDGISLLLLKKACISRKSLPWGKMSMIFLSADYAQNKLYDLFFHSKVRIVLQLFCRQEFPARLFQEKNLHHTQSLTSTSTVPSICTQFTSPSLALSSPELFSFFFRGDLERERERDRRDLRFSFCDSFVCDRDLFGDFSSLTEFSSSWGSICSLSGFSCFIFFSSFLGSFSRICSKDRGMCARYEVTYIKVRIVWPEPQTFLSLVLCHEIESNGWERFGEFFFPMGSSLLKTLKARWKRSWTSPVAESPAHACS